jgi:hypothetical protein
MWRSSFICRYPRLGGIAHFQKASQPGASAVQQHPLIAGAQPEKGTNLLGCQAVNVTQRHHCALLLRQLCQFIRKLPVIFGANLATAWVM